MRFLPLRTICGCAISVLFDSFCLSRWSPKTEFTSTIGIDQYSVWQQSPNVRLQNASQRMGLIRVRCRYLILWYLKLFQCVELRCVVNLWWIRTACVLSFDQPQNFNPRARDEGHAPFGGQVPFQARYRRGQEEFRCPLWGICPCQIIAKTPSREEGLLGGARKLSNISKYEVYIKILQIGMPSKEKNEPRASG